MVKKHGKKQRARRRQDRTGAAYSSAAAGATHTHTPLPDMSALPLVPHGSRVLDLDLAARLVAACRARCQSCQQTLITKVVTEHRPTLAALAGAVYGTLPSVRFAAVSDPTRQWAPLARTAMQAGTGDEAFAAVEAMDEEAAAALLDDALDHWSMGDGAALSKAVTDAVADAVRTVPEAPRRRRPADPMDAFREAGIKVFTLDDLDLPDGVDAYHLAENYGVFVGLTTTPDGQQLPMLTLYPETEGAGIEDLEYRTDWEHWGLHGMPDVDPSWRLRASIADRSLSGLVHVDAEGQDDIELWRAVQAVTQPADWWALLDRVQHVLVVGPVKEADHHALQAAGDAGELLAVVARVSFH